MEIISAAQIPKSPGNPARYFREQPVGDRRCGGSRRLGAPFRYLFKISRVYLAPRRTITLVQ